MCVALDGEDPVRFVDARADSAATFSGLLAGRWSDFLQLRQNRVYRLDEIAQQNGLGGQDGAPFGRVLRIGELKLFNAALLIVRAHEDFSAADGALVSGLAPHLEIALRNHALLARARTSAAIGEALLDRLGVSWSAADGHPTPSRIAAMVSVNGAKRQMMVSRRAVAHNASQARCLEELWSLSPTEARLALALAAGHSIVEAAALVGLTTESGRNYSKRIYSKVGARGLADLVRLVLTHVTMLAY